MKSSLPISTCHHLVVTITGDNVAGIEKSFRRDFCKKPSEVNLAQAAFLSRFTTGPLQLQFLTNKTGAKTDLSAGIGRMKDVLYFMYRNHKLVRPTTKLPTMILCTDFLASRQPKCHTPILPLLSNGARRTELNHKSPNIER